MVYYIYPWWYIFSYASSWPRLEQWNYLIISYHLYFAMFINLFWWALLSSSLCTSSRMVKMTPVPHIQRLANHILMTFLCVCLLLSLWHPYLTLYLVYVLCISVLAFFIVLCLGEWLVIINSIVVRKRMEVFSRRQLPLDEVLGLQSYRYR